LFVVYGRPFRVANSKCSAFGWSQNPEPTVTSEQVVQRIKNGERVAADLRARAEAIQQEIIKLG